MTNYDKQHVTCDIINYKYSLLSINMKTKVDQHVPMHLTYVLRHGLIREDYQREFAERISRKVEVEQRGLAERLSREYKIKFDRGPCRASARLVILVCREIVLDSIAPNITNKQQSKWSPSQPLVGISILVPGESLLCTSLK